MSDKEIFKRDVTEPEAYATDICISYEKSDKVVIPAAAEHSAPVFRGLVENLEHRSGIVVEPADYTEIKNAVFVDSRILQRIEKLKKAPWLGIRGDSGRSSTLIP